MSSPDAQDLDGFFKVLGKEGSADILTRASNGLLSGKEAIRETGLSQKLYYSRLAELRRLGLVVRSGVRTYDITEKGRVVLDLQERLVRAIAQKRGSLPIESRLIPTYSQMVYVLSKRIDNSRARVKLASRYVDTTVTRSVFDALDRNVSVQAIMKSGRTHLGKMGLESFELLKYDALTRAERMIKHARIADIPFSFVVVDGHWSGIELVGPDDTFLAALEFEGEATAAALGILFRHYYRVGTVFPRFW
jgi:DNA-binding HxlR family transcriptional regulator